MVSRIGLPTPGSANSAYDWHGIPIFLRGSTDVLCGLELCMAAMLEISCNPVAAIFLACVEFWKMFREYNH